MEGRNERFACVAHIWQTLCIFFLYVYCNKFGCYIWIADVARTDNDDDDMGLISEIVRVLNGTNNNNNKKRWEEYKRQTQDVLRATVKPHVFVVKCFCMEGLFCRMLLGNIICVVRWARGVNFPEVFSIRNNYIKVLQINSQSTMV